LFDDYLLNNLDILPGLIYQVIVLFTSLVRTSCWSSCRLRFQNFNCA